MSLKVKENIDLDESLIKLGFVKAREYFHCNNVSVRICDREVCISFEAPGYRNPRSYKIALPNILLKMIDAGILE